MRDKLEALRFQNTKDAWLLRRFAPRTVTG
jgi:hypothetical protein